MSGETYKGFRIFNLEFQAMQLGQSNVVMYDSLSSGGGGVEGGSGRSGASEEGGGDGGSTAINYETAGKIINTSTNAIFWTCDDTGLRSHLLEYLHPMINQADNGVGWELDDSTYTRLYNIVNTVNPDDIAAYNDFISRNTNIYEKDNNPTGDKTIQLAPTTYVRVMCFRHDPTGYKAMIGLSLYAMDGDNVLTSTNTNTSYGRIVDPGFRANHIVMHSIRSSDTGIDWHGSTGGLFIAMIPPANSGETQDDWALEYNIQDIRFYPSTMTNVSTFMRSCYHTGTQNSHYRGSCWLRVGTSTNHDAGNNSGVLTGTNMKLSLLLDTKGNVWLSYKYTATTNTKSLTPLIIMGPLYKKKIFANDTLCTSKLGVIRCGLREFTGSNSSENSAWVSFYSSYYDYYYGSNNSGWDYLSSFSADGSSFDNYYVFTAYPAVDSSVHLNYRNAKAGYTVSGLIDEEVIRWNAPDGLVRGQTYNNGEWVYLGTDYTLYAQNGTTGSSYLYPSIKWDAQYNGTKTFA